MGVASLADGASSLARGIDRLADGTSALAGGARQTATGAAGWPTAPRPLPGGIGQLTDAMTTAADGAALVQTQIDGLADDGDSLADRVSDLASGLGTSADGHTAYDETTRDRIGDLAANPVAVDATRVNPVSGAESGFAPAFMAIAAWLGALGAFLVLPAMWRRGDDRRWWLAALRSFGGASAIAIFGTVPMVIVLDLLLGVSVASPGTLLVFAVLAALAFTAVGPGAGRDVRHPRLARRAAAPGHGDRGLGDRHGRGRGDRAARSDPAAAAADRGDRRVPWRGRRCGSRSRSMRSSCSAGLSRASS